MMRKKRRSRKSMTDGFFNRNDVIRKPDSVKNSDMPSRPNIALPCSDFGPIGSRCAASTHRMLMPRQPSSISSRGSALLMVAPPRAGGGGAIVYVPRLAHHVHRHAHHQAACGQVV